MFALHHLRAAGWPAWLWAALLFVASQTPALALDAQQLFQQSQNSVVVVLNYDSSGKAAKFGTGFFFKEGNLVATNYHVIDKHVELRLKLGDGTLVKVESVARYNKEQDLAILRVAKPGKPLALAAGDPQIGEDVLAIGNPGGLERTISTGIVSGIRRRGKVKVYQITAPISPGSSGGPILNSQGSVLGLATFYAQGGQNLNFAVPAGYLEDLLSGQSTMGSVDSAGSDIAPDETPAPAQKTKLEVYKEKDGSISIKKK